MANPISFAELTTLRIGGPISEFVSVTSEAEFIAAVQSADVAQHPLLVIGGGSNLVPSDAGFSGTVIRDARQEVSVQDDGMCGGVTITASAGTNWDALVAQAVAAGWVGFEALSGIPGSVGATPIQNVGAYGAQVSDLISSVRTWDRQTQKVRTFFLFECEFGYRDSIFKRSFNRAAKYFPSPRYVVLSVDFHTRCGDLSAPIRYPQLADALGVEVGEKVPLAQVRAAVLQVRAAKGMVLDDEDHDTWSAGSFFLNPVVSAEQASQWPTAPKFPAPNGQVKIPAAYLIEQAGFTRGFHLPGAGVALSHKHVLAITNQGSGTGAEVRELAQHIQTQVQQAHGVELQIEPIVL